MGHDSLRIDTGLQNEVPFTSNVPADRSPTVPSFRLSSTPSEKLPPSPTDIDEVHPRSFRKTYGTRSNESRKLLAHILGQLANRIMPPSVYDLATAADQTGEKGLSRFLKGGVKLGSGKPQSNRVTGDEDDDAEVDRDFMTDATFDFMSQLKDVLMISVLRGWQIFDEGTDVKAERQHSGKSSSPFRRSISTLHPSGKRSRSPSPASPSANFGGQIHSTELLSQCISILSSVVSEDCRYKIASPRPSCPPNALQALTLKVAQFLLHVHRRTSKVVSQIGFALIPAFYTFPPEMYARLLAFFEECIIRGILDDLREVQGLQDEISFQAPEAFDESLDAPVVSIRVDEAEDESGMQRQATSKWVPWTDTVSSRVLRILSTNAPLQPPSVYFLASLTPPLLATILDNIDFGLDSTASIDVLHRLHRLVDLLVTAKVDAYLDLLEVVAYHSPKSRHAAASMLSAFWPKGMGHVIISRPLASSAYLANSPSMRDLLQDHPYDHQFLPWRFIISHRYPQNDCRSCSSQIDGFGLLCPFCTCAVHFDCYDHPSGCHIAKYSAMSGASVQKVALYRFSYLSSNRRDHGVWTLRKRGHTFRYVNLFTLCLCSACRQPLWGCTAQGLRCTSCLQFVHVRCASSHTLSGCHYYEYDSSHMMIEWNALRQSCVDFYGDILLLSQEQLRGRCFEEISVMASILWTQLQLLANGVALGSILITHNGRGAGELTSHKVAEFELHRVLQTCEDLISQDVLTVSAATEDYLQDNGLQRSEHTIFFDWSKLIYITTTIKFPAALHATAPPASQSSLLTVTQPDILSAARESLDHPFEMLPLSHMRDALGRDFDLHSDAIAKYLLSHLHHLGFFERIDRHPTLFDDNPNVNSISCSFPLPLGLDLSTDVETLFASVEACLSDLDLSVNETGFLLLCRRLWPNGMASEYAVRRLTHAIISWVFAEDDNLATILRDYIAKQQSLPGVRMADDVSPWPEAQTLRHAPPSSVHNGGDYVMARRSLLSHYAIPWLLTLHNESAENYAILLYEISVQLAQPSFAADLLLSPSPIFSLSTSTDVVTHNCDAQYFDRLLRLIIRLSQNSVTFTIFDDLFVRWLEAVSASDRFEEPIPSLSRLFLRDAQESTSRTSVFDSTAGQDGGGAAIDPWRRVISVSTENKAGLLRSLRWIHVFARSGIDVPIQTYFHFITLMEKFQTTVTESLLFVKTIMSSTWQRPTSRFEIQDMFAKLHTRLMPEVLQILSGETYTKDVLAFIRQTLATCLLLYGCNRSKIVDLEMVHNDEIKDMASRRKINIRSSIVSDPIIVPPNFMAAINRYMNADVDDVSCLIAKFFFMFLMRSPYLEPHEVDNFILKNGSMLCNCAWQLYGIRRQEISAFRAPFLLRTLVVDAQPFQLILKKYFRAEGDWELRLEGIARLFRIILDSPTPDFQVEGRQWKSSVGDVFYYFFSSLWADKREEIRLSADTLVSNMLTAHFNAISSCWDEVLSKSPVEERVKLVSFLIQLRSHFPTWKVVSWEVIVETLLEDQYDEKESGDGPAAAHLAKLVAQSMYGLSSKDDILSDEPMISSDTALLRASILHLSLGMIAEGIKIEYNDVLRIKHHLVRALGFDKIALAPTSNGHTFFVEFGETKDIPEVAYPCVTELTVVLDAHHVLDLSTISTGIQESADSTTPLLIGAPYVDVCLGLFCTVRAPESLPVLVLKSMLEALGIVIYKHNFEKVYLRHLQQTLRRAVSRALELLLLDINYECRQLALSVVQAYIKRWHGSIRSFVHFAIEQVAKLVASQSHLSQDALVAQGKAFIESNLVTYCNNGIFTGLLRRDLDPEIFVILKQVTDANAKASPKTPANLRESLLRDTLPRAVETDQTAFQALLKNLQSYIEVIYHQGYSLDLMSFVGQHLVHLARRSLEWASNAINPSPLLSIATILIQHNKSQSRDMLTYTDAILRIALTRLAVDEASLSKLIQVTATLYRKTQTTDSVPTNTIIAVILELLSDGLRMKVRVLPITLKAMLVAVMTTEIAGHTTPAVLYHQQFAAIAENGFHFLQNHVWTDMRTDSDYSASLMIGKFILQAAILDPSVMTRRSSRHYMTIRAWNVLILSALMDPSENWITLIYMQLPTFSSAYQTALRGYLQAGTSPPESAITDINHAYVAIKLWLILAQKRAVKEEEGCVSAFTVWNELWFPFESLVNVFEAEVQVGLSMTLAMLTWSTVAELFLFIRALHSPVASESASHISLLKRLKNLGRGEAHASKLSRALRSMSEPPPEIPIGSHINQAAKDLIAAEKLRILEARREPKLGRGGM
ncbi:uncharacterized protein BT62DRAFT_879722 [Guyanagaster necrorhizus]|uniref:Phorbol-ester/DAG-type domain-containing protein n=1 Tax=Guyanagaster necrorhizus TaxID=856835 RepID=A0A9P7W5G2_9AGAR|nr:uncharacterized protein BT62DRAFT_879722 [Guyanagaster necrorhizus MCA 3950]KAG7452502.1 hypothetical protein BT62DRAFT_879722 [Guyanagaster necrorhizus MCA 3950]